VANESNHDFNEAEASPTSPAKRPGLTENGVIWTLWLTYGAFYFCRTNISAAIPGMKAAGGLELSGAEIGWILASLKIAYGLGQLVNGQMSERISPRVMLAVGMFGSAGLNVLFGLGTGFYFLLFVWACNGYCQSLGWTPCMRVAGNWIPASRRGRAIGIIGTGYQITLGLTYLIASYAVDSGDNWRAAFYAPAGLLAGAGVFMLFFLQETPKDKVAKPTVEEGRKTPPDETPGSVRENVFLTLFNPALWLLGLSLGLLNACRYGFLDWGLTHLIEVQHSSVGKAGLKFFVIAIGAAAGSYLAGWATDRFFGGRRAPVICALLVSLALLTLVYESVARTSVIGTMFLLVAIGFCVYGPQVLLVGTAPADLAHRRTAAAAAGFVNFMGYMGAATGDVVTGHLSEKYEWKVAIYTWAGWALAAAFFTALLWNATGKKDRLLPAFLPKVVGTAAAVIALIVLLREDSPLGLRIAAACVAALMAAGAFIHRRLAIAGLVVAAATFAYTFATYVVFKETDAQLSWNAVIALMAYGVGILASIMIIVERR